MEAQPLVETKTDPTLIARVSDLEGQLKASEDRLKDTRRRLADAEGKLTAAGDSLTRDEAALEALRQAVRDRTERVRELTEDLERSKQSYQELSASKDTDLIAQRAEIARVRQEFEEAGRRCEERVRSVESSQETGAQQSRAETLARERAFEAERIELQSKIEGLRANLQGLAAKNAENEQRAGEVPGLRAENERAARENSTVRDTLAERAEQIVALTSELERLRAELGTARREVGQAGEGLSRSSDENAVLRQTLEQRAAQIASLEVDLRDATRQVEAARADAARAQADAESSRAEANVARQDVGNARERDQEVERVRAESEQLRQRLAVIEPEFNRANAVAKRLRTEAEDIDQLRARAAEADGLRAKVIQLNDAVRDLAECGEESRGFQVEANKLRQKADAAESANAILSERYERMENDLKYQKSMMERRLRSERTKWDEERATFDQQLRAGYEYAKNMETERDAIGAQFSEQIEKFRMSASRMERLGQQVRSLEAERDRWYQGKSAAENETYDCQQASRSLQQEVDQLRLQLETAQGELRASRDVFEIYNQKLNECDQKLTDCTDEYNLKRFASNAYARAVDALQVQAERYKDQRDQCAKKQGIVYTVQGTYREDIDDL